MVISVVNHKGGVGKTITAVNLAAALQRAEKKVLLIDTDSQQSSTMHLGFTKTYFAENHLPTLWDELNKVYISRGTGEDFEVDPSVVVTTHDGIDLIPASSRLTELEELMSARAEREKILSDYISYYKDKYDYIFMDCHSSLGLMTKNALAASDLVLIPTCLDRFAAEGMAEVMACVRMIKRFFNPHIQVVGVFTRVDMRLNEAKFWLNEIVSNYGNAIRFFDTMIPEVNALSMATSFGVSGISYNSDSAGAQAYINLAEELIGEKIKTTPKIYISLEDLFLNTAYQNEAPSENLLESIREEGIKNRVQVREMQNGRYELVHGYKRVQCAKALGISKIPAEVIDIRINDIPLYRHNANMEAE